MRWIVLALVACNSGHPPSRDAPTGPAFTGTVEKLVALQRMPLAGAAVQLSRDDGSQLGEATTDASGAFAIAVAPPLPIDGFFKVQAPGMLDTYSHLVLPASQDPHAKILTMARAELDALAQAAGTTQQPGTSLVIAETIRADGASLPGATIQPVTSSSVTLPVCYGAASGLPDCAGPSATVSDGLGWVFSVPATSLTVGGIDSTGAAITGPSFDVLVQTVVFTPVRP